MTGLPAATCGGFLSNGVPVEMGGQWVGPTQDAVLDLIKELGLETFPSYDDGEALTVFDGNVVRYADETFGLPLDTRHGGRPAAGSRSRPLPPRVHGGALGDRRRGRPRPADPRLVADRQHRGHRRPALLPSAGPGDLLRAGAELSLLHFLFYVKSGTSLETLVATTGGAQESRVVGGTHQISERMAEELGDRVGSTPSSGRSTRTTNGVRVRVRRRRGHRGSRGRRAPPDPGRAGSLRSAAAGPARRAHPADARRGRDQVPGRLRHALLARGRSQRLRAQPRRRVQRRPGQLPARRVVRRPGRLPRGHPRPHRQPSSVRGGASRARRGARW